LCRFYKWTPADVRAMTLEDIYDATEYRNRYVSKMNESR
jgi:hypothetical protein